MLHRQNVQYVSCTLYLVVTMLLSLSSLIFSMIVRALDFVGISIADHHRHVAILVSDSELEHFSH